MFFWGGKIGQVNVFDVLLEKKKAFLGYKNENLKKSKKGEFFLKGLVHGFGKKIDNFLSFSFRHNRPGKCMTIFWKEKRLFWAIKTRI